MKWNQESTSRSGSDDVVTYIWIFPATENNFMLLQMTGIKVDIAGIYPSIYFRV